jgi:hypothetical protein
MPLNKNVLVLQNGHEGNVLILLLSSFDFVLLDIPGRKREYFL